MTVRAVEIPNTPYWQPRVGELGEVVTGLSELAQSVETIFLTPIGSVPLMPRFGFNALLALGKPIYTASRMLERMAIEAFYWEPRVDVLSAKAAVVSDSVALLCICTRYDKLDRMFVAFLHIAFIFDILC